MAVNAVPEPASIDRDEVQVAEVEDAVAVRIPNDRFVAWRTANAATGRPTL